MDPAHNDYSMAFCQQWPFFRPPGADDTSNCYRYDLASFFQRALRIISKQDGYQLIRRMNGTEAECCCSVVAAGDAFGFGERPRRPGLRKLSRLNTQPARRHGSRPVRGATAPPYDSFIHYLPPVTGASPRDPRNPGTSGDFRTSRTSPEPSLVDPPFPGVRIFISREYQNLTSPPACFVMIARSVSTKEESTLSAYDLYVFFLS